MKEKTTTGTNRIDWIDIAKALAIFLVILGHMMQFVFPDFEFTIIAIYSFHMPAFFILSGMTFSTTLEHKSFGAFAKRNFISLGKIFLIFALMNICLKVAASRGNVAYALRDFLNWRALLVTNTSILAYLWFFPVLFIAKCITFLVIKYIKKDGYRFLIFLGLAACGFLYRQMSSFPLPFCLNVGVFATVFIYIGVVLRRILDKKSPWMPLICFLSGIVYILANVFHARVGGTVDMFYLLDFYNIALFIVTSLCGTALLIGISKILSEGVCSGILRSIGQKTVWIYGIHFYLVSFLQRFQHQLNAMLSDKKILEYIVCVLGSVVILIAIEEGINLAARRKQR